MILSSLLFCSCKKSNETINVNETIDECRYRQSKIIALSSDEEKIIEEIWQNNNWTVGCTRCGSEYTFITTNGTAIRYSSHGCFNYVDADYHLTLSSEDKNTVDAILEQYVDDANDQTQ